MRPQLARPIAVAVAATRHAHEPARHAADAQAPAAVPGPGLLPLDGAADPRGERVRALRAELQLQRASTAQGDVVVLLSPCAGEGRTRLAAELAIAFAQIGRATLLVDADLRRPQQHALFGIDPGPGLAQAVTTGTPPPWHTVRGLPGLAVLTAGDAPGDPLGLLCDPGFAALIDGWRDSFDQLVIDTPPVGPFADALAVAGAAGRVLALSRAGHTPTLALSDMLARLAAVRAQVLGAVISHF